MLIGKVEGMMKDLEIGRIKNRNENTAAEH